MPDTTSGGSSIVPPSTDPAAQARIAALDEAPTPYQMAFAIAEQLGTARAVIDMLLAHVIDGVPVHRPSIVRCCETIYGARSSLRAVPPDRVAAWATGDLFDPSGGEEDLVEVRTGGDDAA